MLKKGYLLALPGRVLIIGVYFLYFLVQLDFQFTSLHKDSRFQTQAASSLTAEKNQPAGIGKVTSDISPSCHLKINRLNKRFHPENIFGIIVSQNCCCTHYDPVYNKIITSAPLLISYFLSSVLFRGPPAIA